jgi:foldase protein PrsA
MRTLLTRRLAPVLLLAALFASACGPFGESPAATVNGQDITVDALTRELKVIQANKTYRGALEQAYKATIAGKGKGTFGTSFTSQILSLRIYYRLLEQSLAKQGVKITASDEQRARSSMTQQLASLGAGVFRSFPADYRKELVHNEALIEVAQEKASTGAAAEKYFEAHKADFATACASHILVSTDNRSAAAATLRAEQLKARIDAGADFAEVAKADSDDPGSKVNGGDLDCGPKGRFVTAFEDAEFALPVGKVSDPVKTEFGYHLILVRSRTDATLAEVREQVAQGSFNAYLLDLVCGARTDVTVNPRYGTWDTVPCKDDEGLAKVTAPKAPKKSS